MKIEPSVWWGSTAAFMWPVFVKEGCWPWSFLIQGHIMKTSYYTLLHSLFALSFSNYQSHSPNKYKHIKGTPFCFKGHEPTQVFCKVPRFGNPWTDLWLWEERDLAKSSGAQQQHMWPWGRSRRHQIYLPPVWENGKESWTIAFVICAQPGTFPKISKVTGNMSEFSREILSHFLREKLLQGQVVVLY